MPTCYTGALMHIVYMVFLDASQNCCKQSMTKDTYAEVIHVKYTC